MGASQTSDVLSDLVERGMARSSLEVLRETCRDRAKRLLIRT